MSKKNNENLKELLVGFLGYEEASRAADDIAAGESILDSNPAPRPSEALLADIKRRMAVASGKRYWARNFTWRAAAAAAAIAVVAWAGALLVQNRHAMLQQAEVAFWQDSAENNIDAKIAQLDQPETGMPVITFETNGGNDLAVADVSDELNEINDTFWEG